MQLYPSPPLRDVSTGKEMVRQPVNMEKRKKIFSSNVSGFMGAIEAGFYT